VVELGRRQKQREIISKASNLVVKPVIADANRPNSAEQVVLVIGGKHVELVGRLVTVVTYGLDNCHLKLHPHKPLKF